MDTTLTVNQFNEFFKSINNIESNKIEIFDYQVSKVDDRFETGMFSFSTLLETIMYIVIEMIKDDELTNDVFIIPEIYNIICEKRLFGLKPSEQIQIY